MPTPALPGRLGVPRDPGTSSFAVAILAGGRSVRMGCDKAHLIFEGKTLLARQVDLAWSLEPAEVVIAGRSDAELEGLAARGLPDIRPGLGPLGGLATVLGAATAPHVLLLAVDMPGLTAGFVGRLLARRAPEVGVVPRSARGGWEPVIGVYPKSMTTAVQAALAAGRLGLRRFVAEEAAQGHLLEYAVAPEEEHQLANWNSPGDLPGAVFGGP